MPSSREELELELLALRVQRGDSQAFEQLVQRFEKPLFYFIRRIVVDESQAWDTLQKTWLRVFKHPPQSSEAGRLTAWLYRVARNAALNHLRDEGRHPSPSNADVLTAIDENSDSVSLEAFEVEDVHRGLDRLALSDREVLTLHFLEELSTQEVADILAIPRGTVKWRIHRAKKNLKNLLERS